MNNRFWKIVKLLSVFVITCFTIVYATVESGFSGNLEGIFDADGNMDIEAMMIENGLWVPKPGGGFYVTSEYFDKAGTASERAQYGTNGATPAQVPGQKTTGTAGSSAIGKNMPVVSKEYPHSYPEITEEALEALAFFTKDGKPDSAYLEIENTSSQNKVSGKTLNLSKTNKEDMVIKYVSEDAVKSEWKFSEWESGEELEIDLGSSLEKDEECGYDGTYTLLFADGGKVEVEGMTYKVNLSEPDALFHVYSKDGEGYEEIFSATTDSEGFFELHPVELTEYVISSTDIIAEKEAENERIKAEEEAEKLATENAAKSEEIPEAKVVDNNTEDEKSVKDNPVVNTFEENATPSGQSVPWIPIGIGAVVILVVIGSVVVKKK